MDLQTYFSTCHVVVKAKRPHQPSKDHASRYYILRQLGVRRCPGRGGQGLFLEGQGHVHPRQPVRPRILQEVAEGVYRINTPLALPRNWR